MRSFREQNSDKMHTAIREATVRKMHLGRQKEMDREKEKENENISDVSKFGLCPCPADRDYDDAEDFILCARFT